MAEKQKDPLVQVNLRAMEFIWTQVPKEVKDGVEYAVYVETDLPFLYNSGMVDTERFTLDDWKKAFEDARGTDGRYWVNHEKMLSLGHFRFHRVVREPFDPLKIKTGKYTPERLWKLFETSILPSTSLPKHMIKNIFDSLYLKHKSFSKTFAKDLEKAKERGEKVDLNLQPTIQFSKEGGKEYIVIDRDTLINLKALLDNMPSPRRKLEMSVNKLRMDALQKLSEAATKPQESTFEAGKDFRKTTQKDLKDMLVKASDRAEGGRKLTGEVINVGDVQKKKRPPTKF